MSFCIGLCTHLPGKIEYPRFVENCTRFSKMQPSIRGKAFVVNCSHLAGKLMDPVDGPALCRCGVLN